jgi:uncharacterized protein with HEPN domain
MQPDVRDAALLWDMLIHGRLVLKFVRSETFETYSDNQMLRLAVERSIQIIGEAANRLSDEFRTVHPDIPWRPIIKQRHVLVHDYGVIDNAKIWRVATHYVPELVQMIEPIMPPQPPDPRPETREET